MHNQIRIRGLIIGFFIYISMIGAGGFFANIAHAQTLPLTNLTEEDYKNVVNDMSANFTHTSVSGASSLGSLFGFEFGLVAGGTRTPHLNDLANRAVPGSAADKLPHGSLLGALTIPLGLTVEVGIVPKVGKDEFKFSSYDVALKWTPTELFLDLPLSLAAKLQLSKAKVDFAQKISGVDVAFNYDSTVTGLTLLASKNFVFVEPYFGLSYLRGKGDLVASGTNNTFTFTGQSASETVTTTAFMLGAEVKLIFFKIGVEYANLFNTSQYSGKFSCYF
jgi:hypothetical protein